jgi:hypothetical protein
MGVSGPWKGSRDEWLEENGWRPVTVAQAGAYELRAFPANHSTFKIAAHRDGWLAGVNISPALLGGYSLHMPDGEEIVGESAVEVFEKWLRLISS